MLGEGRKRSYTVATTGAKLTYRHAIDVLGRFASSLVRDNIASCRFGIEANIYIMLAI